MNPPQSPQRPNIVVLLAIALGVIVGILAVLDSSAVGVVAITGGIIIGIVALVTVLFRRRSD